MQNERFYSTGEAAAMLRLKLRDIDYACSRDRAGPLAFCGGRRVLTAANVRRLARHFGKPVPPGCEGTLEDNCVLDLEQRGTR